MTLYHGTNKDFDKFDINQSHGGSFGRGIYFAVEKERAKNFGVRIVGVKLKPCKLFMAGDFTQFRKYTRAYFADYLYRNGYKGIIGTSPRGGLQVCLFTADIIEEMWDEELL